MITTAKVFQPGMVLQREKPLEIRGTAPAGTELLISIQDVRVSVTADSDGNWRAALPALRASERETLSIVSNRETLRLSDIAVGEVWIAGGQSNMEFWMRYEKHVRETDGYSNRRVRFYDVPKIAYDGQERDFDYTRMGRWRAASSPAELAYFSAAGFYFAKELERELDVPVGIIGCNWGGTSACAWMSAERAERVAAPWTTARRARFQGLDMAEYWANASGNPANNTGNPFANPFNELMLPRTPSAEEIRTFFPGPDPYADTPQPQSLPGSLYEHMVKTIAPFPVRGVLWYQGETDDEIAPQELYRDALPALMDDWRRLWNDETLPFLVVQLPGYESWNGFGNNAFQVLRQCQMEAVDADENAYLCSISDAGERFDIHPKDKRVVGERLALLALGHIYGREILCDAPRLSGVSGSGNRITLSFSNAEGGLTVSGNQIAALAVYSASGPLDFSAEVDGTRILITLADGAERVRVDFAQTAWYRVNLYNRSGIPAIPFSVLCPEE